MQTQIAEYFNHFYQTVLREHIHDAIVHSEWLYFLSMFKSTSLDKERIDLYLGILSTEKGKRKIKENNTSTDSAKSRPDSKIKLINSGENHIITSDIKLQKRLSQNWKPTLTSHLKPTKELKATPEFSLKKTISTEEQPNRSLRSIEDEPKTIRTKNQPIYALPSSSPNSYAYIRPKSPNELAAEQRQAKLRERNFKLMEISRKLVGVFQGGRLRA